MKKIILIAVFVIIIAFASIIAYLLLNEKMLIGFKVHTQYNPKVTFIIGDASYRTGDNDKWKMAIVGTELEKGYEVKTEKNSLMDIRFQEGTAIKLSEKSRLRIDDISIKKLFLNIEEGSLYGKFNKLFKNHSIIINTPTVAAAVRGTELAFEIKDILELAKTDIEEAESGAAKDSRKGGKEKEKDAVKETEEDAKTELQPETIVYSLSGITEIKNPEFEDQMVFLAYQNKLHVVKGSPPSNPEGLTEEEIVRLRIAMNSIHFNEVLLISNKINFKVGSSRILRSSYKELDKIVKVLNEKGVAVRIEGHTDNRGSASSNRKLSMKRASSIRNYFIKKSIDSGRIEITGFGMSKPIADNKTKKGRAQNRRVEFIIIE